MQTSSINPPAKLQRRHTGTKPGEEIKVRVEGYARVTKGDRPGVPSGPARQASKGHATDFIPSHSDFSLPGPGYAKAPKICRPPYDPGTIRICGPDVTDAMLSNLLDRYEHSYADDHYMGQGPGSVNQLLAPGGMMDFKLIDKYTRYEVTTPDLQTCPTNCGEFTRTFCGICVLADWPGNFALGFVLRILDPRAKVIEALKASKVYRDYPDVATLDAIGAGYDAAEASRGHLREFLRRLEAAGASAYADSFRTGGTMTWGGTLLPPKGYGEPAAARGIARNEYWNRHVFDAHYDIKRTMCESAKKALESLRKKVVSSSDKGARAFPEYDCKPCYYRMWRTGLKSPLPLYEDIAYNIGWLVF